MSSPESLLIVIRRVGADWESEPIVIRPYGHAGVALFLDDGDELIFDRDELLAALTAAQAKAA